MRVLYKHAYLIQKVFVFFLLIASSALLAQNKYTISGYVRDAETGETFIGATVLVKALNKGTITNEYGFYSLTLEQKKYEIIISYLGYQAKKFEIVLDKNIRLNIDMKEIVIEAEEVVITGERKDANIQSTDMGKIDISIEQIKILPVVFGEVDILKSIQLLPGVQSAGEGNAGFYVRGGGSDQNLILLDEAIVYNTNHLFGFFSVFNADAINNTTLIKGGMPANYGGRLSSVLDISMKDGNDKKYQVEGGIGLISSRLTFQGPLKKNKSSFIISGRRTYIDLLMKPAIKNTDYEGNGYFFYDLNAKVNYRFSDNNRLFLSSYFGRDVFSYASPLGTFDIRIPWGNVTSTLRWNHLFNDKLFMNLSAIYNDYNFAVEMSQYNWDFKLFSGIKDANFKLDFNYFPHILHNVKFGVNYTYHIFIPTSASANSGEEIALTTDDISKKYAHEAAWYILDNFDLTDRIKINTGLRLSFFQQVGPYDDLIEDAKGKVIDTVSYSTLEPIKTYFGWEPRISIRYILNPKASIKGSFTLNNQYLHLVSNAGTTLPTDVWVPSSLLVEPQIATQYAIGYFRNFLDNTYETSLECYYKNLNNQIEYKEGYFPELDKEIEREFVFGTGQSYGIELFLKKKYGKLNGWLGYTLSNTTRHFDDLNNGNPFPAKFDRRHDFSIVASYKLNKRWTFAATFVFGTGSAFTLPVARYFIENVIINEYGDINGYRLKPYHRMDISATLHGKKSKKFKSYWVFAVYNIYNRKNPFFIYFDNEGDILDGTFQVKAKQVSLFPVIPSVTWNFKF